MATKNTNKPLGGAGINKPKREHNNPVALPKPNQRFVPIPEKFQKPTGDLNIDLSEILGTDIISKINSSGKLVYHSVGDTGGINDAHIIQSEIAKLMEDQINSATEKEQARFFFHLGDVVYYNGMTSEYPEQFDEPYKDYPAKIMAIPGNHDGQIKTEKKDPPDHEPSLLGFYENFCDKAQQFSRYSSYRKTINQPWFYWTLNAPFITVIGLYSNIDGSFDDKNDSTQVDWLISQLRKAPNNKCLAITVHHPCYSLDTSHGGYPLILDKLDSAFKSAQRFPNVIFSGHVHNYQRFTRKIEGKEIAYVVAGAGGYAHSARAMHKLFKNPKNNKPIKTPFQTSIKEVSLIKYNEENPGYMQVSVDKQFLTAEYFLGNFDGSKAPSAAYDILKLDWTKWKVK